MNLVFKALSDPTRRRILQLLRERPVTAGQIAAHFDSAKPTLSAHFSVLREADLVESEKAGTTVTYDLGGTAGTRAFADAIIERMADLPLVAA